MKSKLFVSSMTTIVGLYGILIFFLIIVFNIANIPLELLLVMSVIVVVLQFLLSPFFMDIVMKLLYRADFDEEIPDYLKKYIEDICNKNKMKYPRIGFINDGGPNAFTYGRFKNDARIMLTKGIFDLLDPEEVKAVVSHEIGHAVHYDMFLMTAAQLVPLILYYVYDFTFNVNNNRKKSSDKDGSSIIGLIAYVLYIISEYIILWFSRTREYYADEFSVFATQNPNALASALVKIGYGLTTSSKKKNVNAVSALGIFDSKASKSLVVSSYDDGKISKDNVKKAARWELWNPWAKWYEFNSTHPLISKRIKAICRYCNRFNQDEYIIFDEKKPESYVDDFLLEVFIKFLPLLCFIISVVISIFNLQNSLSNYNLYIGFSIILFAISLFITFNYSHKNKGYKNMTVADLLGEVKVSGVNSVPCIVKGKIIGRGNPGNIFSEDFIIKDESGIIFLDYNQPLNLVNKLFALLKSNKYIDQVVEIKGWYRRNPVPYIEIYTITIDGNVKKCYTYMVSIILIMLLVGIGVFFILHGLV